MCPEGQFDMRIKRFNIRISALILALILAVSAIALLGCDESLEWTTIDTMEKNYDPNGVTDTEYKFEKFSDFRTNVTEDSESLDGTGGGDNGNGDNGGEETEPIVETSVSLIKEGNLTDFTIVVSDGVSTEINFAANKLKLAFSSSRATSITVRNESYFKIANNGSLKGPKIVVGELSTDSISKNLANPLRDSEYVIKVTDGSVYIVGGSDEATARAVDYFIANYLEKADESLSFDPGVIFEMKSTAEYTELTVSGNDIFNYDIIYYDSVYAKACAERIQAAIYDISGYTLDVSSDSAKTGKYEILVGKTNRIESKNVRDAYSRPNVYYDIKAVGDKLVVMGEGYVTLDVIGDAFEQFSATAKGDKVDVSEIYTSADILATVDSEGQSMVNRASGTDLRVFHWNMCAPYCDPNVTAPPVVYEDNVTRGEVMADIILQLMPDIITTNEFYKSHNGNTVFFDTVMSELSDFYTCLDSDYEVNKPEQGADVIPGKTINENIIYNKNAGLRVVSSGWRYFTERTTATSANPNGWVYYHGSHTATFEKNGQKFIISAGHYPDSRSDYTWAAEHLEAVADAQAAIGGGLPVILTGDMYTGYTSSSSNSGYKYLAGQGYIDSQRTATVNANNNISHGTFHNVGVRQTTRISEDFIWHTSDMKALCFKVLTSQEIDDTSDHYPVMADLKFN